MDIQSCFELESIKITAIVDTVETILSIAQIYLFIWFFYLIVHMYMHVHALTDWIYHEKFK